MFHSFLSLFPFFFCKVKSSMEPSLGLFSLWFKENLFKSLFSILQKEHILSKRNVVLHQIQDTEIKILWNGLVEMLFFWIDCLMKKIKGTVIFNRLQLKMLFSIYFIQNGRKCLHKQMKLKPYLPMYTFSINQTNICSIFLSPLTKGNYFIVTIFKANKELRATIENVSGNRPYDLLEFIIKSIGVGIERFKYMPKPILFILHICTRAQPN